MFTELGNCFPTLSCITGSTSLSPRFIICLFNTAVIVGLQRRRWWSLKGIQSVLRLYRIYYFLRRWMFPFKMGLHSASTMLLVSSSVLSYGNFGGALRLGPALNFFPPFVLLAAGAAAALSCHC